MSNNSYKIVPYESSYYESFKKLSESFPEFQPSNYIYHTQEIFEYLYRGFGHNDSSSLIIVNITRTRVRFHLNCINNI